MKILVISSNIFSLPLTNYGGLEEVAFLQAVHLQKRGHEVSVVAPKGSQLPEGIELIESELREPEQNTWGRYRQRLEAGEWDVVLDSSWEKWSYMSSLSRDPQIAVMGINHTDPKIYSEPPPVRWPLLVGISESHANEIRRHLKVDCRVVKNGINLSRYTIDPNVKRNGRFLALGRYTPEKGMLTAINMARRLRLPLDCVGDTEIVGGMDYVERCRAACDGLQIRFMPGVARDRTVELYRTHEALLNLIDWEEPFGLCVHPETQIPTNIGIRRAEEVEPGTIVLTSVGQWAKVNATTSRQIEEELIAIRPYGGLTALVTQEHRSYAMKRIARTFFAQPEWIESAKLSPGDMLLYPIDQEIKDIPTLSLASFVPNLRENDNGLLPTSTNQYGKSHTIRNGHLLPKTIPINEDFLRLYGYYLAEGNTNHGSKVIEWSFHKQETLYQEDVVNLIGHLFGLKAKVRFRNDSNGCCVYLTNSAVARLFDTLAGRGSAHKRIEPFLMHLPPEKQKALLIGYWRGDGCLGPTNWSALTVSVDLAWQLSMLLMRQGVVPGLRLQPPRWRERHIKGVLVRTSRPAYVISISPEDRARFGALFGLESKQTGDGAGGRKGFIHGAYLYRVVRSLQRCAYSGPVVDLAVEGGASFCGISQVFHNTTIESSACGMPVLAFNRGAMPELIQPGKNGFLFNNESEVEAFLKKPDWGGITPESCRAVAEQFSAERMCERYEQLCREVVEQGARW